MCSKTAHNINYHIFSLAPDKRNKLNQYENKIVYWRTCLIINQLFLM